MLLRLMQLENHTLAMRKLYVGDVTRVQAPVIELG